MNIKKYYDDPNVICIYPFGSRVYGSHTSDSDFDYILVVKDYFDSNDINIHVYTVSQFQLKLDNHDIQILECIYLPKKLQIKENYIFIHNLDRQKLRASISTIASNSWVKGKKKLIISGDYDENLAIKSIFHSLRILDFGIQLGTEGKIYNYSSMNWLLTDLKKLATQFKRDELWEAIDTKYRTTFNNMSSQFKTLCPKATESKAKDTELRSILNRHQGFYLDDATIESILQQIRGVV